MAKPGHRHGIGPSNGKLILQTSRQGLAAQAGHDLTIEVSRWSGEVVVGEDRAASSVEVTVDLGSLTVLKGTGGVKSLSERDKREIAQTAGKQLRTDRHPTAAFTSTAVRPNEQGGVLEGTLTLVGIDRQVQLDVVDLGDGRFRATGKVVQSEFGIKPYTAFFGALKLADPVEVDVEVDLSGAGR